MIRYWSQHGKAYVNEERALAARTRKGYSSPSDPLFLPVLDLIALESAVSTCLSLSLCLRLLRHETPMAATRCCLSGIQSNAGPVWTD